MPPDPSRPSQDPSQTPSGPFGTLLRPPPGPQMTPFGAFREGVTSLSLPVRHPSSPLPNSAPHTGAEGM